MTSVLYEYDADVRDGNTWRPLPVVSITPSVVRDRVAYTAADITCGRMDATTRALFDPRTVTAVRWRIRQVDLNGATLGHLPRVGAGTGQYATMHVRTLQRTLDSVTVTVSGGETLADDKLNLGPHEDGTVAATTGQLVNWALERVTGTTNPAVAADAPARITPADDHAAEVLASKPWHPYVGVGESFAAMLETELSSQDCRLLDAWGLGWYVCTRSTPPTYMGAPTTVRLSSHEDVPAGVHPIIVDMSETITREGDWADAVVAQGDATTDGYVSTWRHLARQAAHTKGLIVDTGRSEPSGNLAESIAARAAARGHDLTITARVRFDVLPGMTLEAHFLDGVTTATIVAVTWDLDRGEMTVTAQSARTVTIDETTREDGAPTATVESLDAGMRALAARITAPLQKAARLPDAMQSTWDDSQITGL